LPAKAFESATGFAINLGRETAEGAEFLGIGQRFVNSLRARLEINFLMDGAAIEMPPSVEFFPSCTIAALKSTNAAALQHGI
jgi:hypothetical protein